LPSHETNDPSAALKQLRPTWLDKPPGGRTRSAILSVARAVAAMRLFVDNDQGGGPATPAIGWALSHEDGYLAHIDRRWRPVRHHSTISAGQIWTRNSAVDAMLLRKGIFMFKTFTSSAQLLLVFLSIAPLLGACHATAGAGRDISKTGQAITRSANDATPR